MGIGQHIALALVTIHVIGFVVIANCLTVCQWEIKIFDRADPRRVWSVDGSGTMGWINTLAVASAWPIVAWLLFLSWIAWRKQ